MQKTRTARWFLGLTMWMLTACGAAEEAETRAVMVRMTPAAHGMHAADALPAPVEIVLTLAGPTGVRTERLTHDAHGARFDALAPGWWRLRGDGLDADGNVAWVAAQQQFRVAPGETVRIALSFEPIAPIP